MGHVLRMKRLYRFGALCVFALWVSTDATGLAYWVAARWIAAIDAMDFYEVAIFYEVAVFDHTFPKCATFIGFGP